MRERSELYLRAFSAAFKGSPAKRATLRGLKSNAAVLGNVGTAGDVGLLERVRAEEEPEETVREHAEWSLSRLAARRA